MRYTYTIGDMPYLVQELWKLRRYIEKSKDTLEVRVNRKCRVGDPVFAEDIVNEKYT